MARTTSSKQFTGAAALALCSLLLAATATGQSPSVDSFNPGADAVVTALALQPDGKVVVGGSFTTLAGQPRARLARLHADGTLDAAFNPGANDYLLATTVLPDGQILVGGAFTTVANTPRGRLARLLPDGALDPAFVADADGSVNALIPLADRSVLVGGSFTNLAGQPRGRLARLLPGGQLDAAFNPDANDTVYAVAPLPNGGMLVGGKFTRFGAVPCGGLARLNADGTLDPTFTNGVNRTVHTLAVQPDGGILVGGDFISLDGQGISFLGRLGTNGITDASFNPRPNSQVFSLAPQADGHIVFSGAFTTVGGVSFPRNRIARLAAAGALDNAYNPNANHWIYALVQQADGKVLAAGHFTTLTLAARNRIARLNAAAAATNRLAVSGSTITWLRGGSSPEVWRTTFEASSGGANWSPLGAGQRIVGGWRLAGVTVSAGMTVRARGYMAGGYFNGSGGIVETSMAVVPQTPPVILANAAFGVRSNVFGFEFTGTPGQVVVVEGSDHLRHWQPLVTNVLGDNPAWFGDPAWSQLPSRAYRLRSD